MLQNEWHRRAITSRFFLVGICIVLGLADWRLNILPGSWQLLLGGSTAMLLLNEIASLVRQRGAAPPWHFWMLQVVDTLILGLLVYVLGTQGYLGIPFLIFAAGGYALGFPRAAKVQLAMACAVYPVARLLGLHVLDGVAPYTLVVAETFCLTVIGWLTMQGPIHYLRRVRRTRLALSALERGDFDVRLPTRALDDVGFLGVSFNVTAETLGNAVRRLEDEVQERSRAEAAMRDAQLVATRMADRMATVADAAAGVLAADSARALRIVVRDACKRVIELGDFALALYDANTEQLRFLAEVPRDDVTSTVTPDSDVRRVIEERHTLVCRDACGRFEGASPREGTLMRTPVIVGNEVLAILAVCSDVADAYGPPDIAVFEALAALAATALRNILLVDALRSSKESLSHQANHDGLTGLANRRRFRDRALQAFSDMAPEHVAVLALDLDGFKQVNDALGHAAGDRLLQQVAERLLNATRGSDLVARLGGDEFAILLEHVPDDRHAIVVAERIIRSLGAPFALRERTVTVGASVGIALGRARDGEPDGMHAGFVSNSDRYRDPVDTLLHEADVALYRAKTAGKARWMLFDASMHDEERKRAVLEAELRRAMAAGELQLLYQPIVAMQEGRLNAVEALLRWTHRDRGAISPSEFVPIAEESGFIVELGRWVLATACRAAAEWHAWQREHAPGDPPLTLAVNISCRQLHDAAFARDVVRIAREEGMPLTALMLEFSEATLTADRHVSRTALQTLRDAGIRVAIDDFGTGQSSLGYLQGLPVDVLKIDRSFIAGLSRGGAQSVPARTILALGEALDLQTVAEGVEDLQQQASLQEMGCALGQGFHFARPMPAADIAQMLVRSDLAVEAL
ncbi:MAG: EAL domain-containing protein [Gemmatimonadaceae bacterium]